MKKILFAVPLLSLFFAACDPIVDEVEKDGNVTAEELTNSFTISAKSEGNNNLTFNLSPVRYVKVYDASNDACVAMGTAPSCQIVPPARSLDFYITTMNQDGSITKSQTKSINVSEFTDLPALFNDIFGDGHGGFTTTTWGWDETANGVWGNGAYMEHDGPAWWVVTIDGIDEQATGKNLPLDGKDGWMKLSLSGVEMSRGDKGSVSVNENVVKSGWDKGTMTFSGTYPLMGVQPNSGDTPHYVYQILKSDGEHLTLCAGEPGAGDWGTAWFWNFKKK